MARALSLGRWTAFDRPGAPQPLGLPAHHLVTHAAIVGMTGSGKTGPVFVLVEEALRCGVPVLLVDLNGDLPNLLLSLPMGSADAFVRWIDPHRTTRPPAGGGRAALAAERDEGLRRSGMSPEHVETFRASTGSRC